MGCSSQKVANVEPGPTIDRLFINSQLLYQNVIQIDHKNQTKLAINYNEIIRYIGKWLLQQINDTSKTFYHLQFDKNYMISEHKPAIKILINLVNVFIRRESKGCFYGIGTYVDIGNNTLEVDITPINQICLDELFFKYYKIHELQNEIMLMLKDEYKRGNNFLEIIYDPKMIDPQKIKEFNSIIDMIVNDIDPNCGCLRQLNKHSSFTFTLLIFQKKKDIVSLQELLFGKRYQHLIIVIIHFLQGKDSVLDIQNLTEQTTFYESFLPFINFILFIQYKYDTALVAHTVARQSVTSVSYKRVSSENKKHYHYLYYDLKHSLDYDQVKQLEVLYGTEMEIFKKEMNIEVRMSGISTDYSIQSVIKAISMMSQADDVELEDCDVDKVVQYILHFYQKIVQGQSPNQAFLVKVSLGHIGNDFVNENFELIQEKVNDLIYKMKDSSQSPMYVDTFISQVNDEGIQYFIQRVLLNKKSIRNLTPFSNFATETPRMLNENLDVSNQGKRPSTYAADLDMLPPLYQEPYGNANASVELLHENRYLRSQQNSLMEEENREVRIARRKKKVASRRQSQELPEM